MINKSILTGRLTRNPELKTTQNGKSVISFTLANETGYGEYKKTNFPNIVAWGKTAEFVANYFKKGSAMGLVGHIETRDFEKDGRRVYVTEIVADEVHFIESKKNENSNADTIPEEDFSMFPGAEDNDLPF